MASYDEMKTWAARTRWFRDLIAAVPHSCVLGMEVTHMERGKCWMELPYDERFVGDTRTGIFHGGVIISLLDVTCSMAAQSALKERHVRATIDLRIDYMRPADPGRSLLSEATCDRVTRTVAFVSGRVYHDSPKIPIAHSMVTFMMSPPPSGAD